MTRAIAFLLPPAVALVGMRLNRVVLGRLGQTGLGPGLRFALGLGTGMLVSSQALLLCVVAGWNASRYLAMAIGLWTLIEVGLGVRSLRRPTLPQPSPRHLWWLALAPLVYAAWVYGRLATVEGTVEFDAHAFWVFKAKMLYLVQGEPLRALFGQSNLAYAHLDYPALVPCLYTLTYGAVGGVNEFVCKVWPFWMVVALCAAVLSLTQVTARPRALPILGVLVFCFLPATVQFVRAEGGTMPMVFFVGLSALLFQRVTASADPDELAAALPVLAGAAMTKFEGLLWAVLWLGLLALVGWRQAWLRTHLRRRALRRALLLSVLAIVPYLVYRLDCPVPHPESAWLATGLADPAATWQRFPQSFWLNVGGRFFHDDFFRWQSFDGTGLDWAGKWLGIGSFANAQLSVLPWLVLVLLGLAVWRRRARRPIACVGLVTLVVFTVLSLVIACLPRMQRSLPRMIEFSTGAQIVRYFYPFFVALFLVAVVVWSQQVHGDPSRSE